MAQNAVSNPFSLPVQQYAGFNPQQQLAFQQTQDAAQSGQPYFNQANQYFNQSAQPISASQINNYMNPYASYVMGNLQEQQGQQMADLTGKLTQTAGGVGADRIAVGQAELARQQNLASGQTLSGIYGSALGAAQQNAQMQQAAGYGLGNLGATAQNTALSGAGANYGMGAQQQNLSQNQLNAQYANTLAQLAYPYQNAQFLAGITGGLAGALGGTTGAYQQTTPAQPSIFSQLAGLGTAGTGLAGAFNAFGGGGVYGGTPGTSIGGATGPTSYGGVNGPMPLVADGGRIGYDDGGSVPSMSDPTLQVKPTNWMHADNYIPDIQVQSHVNQPKVNFSNPQAPTSNFGTDLGNIAKGVAAIAPFLLARGGAVQNNPFMVEGYDDGGTPKSPPPKQPTTPPPVFRYRAGRAFYEQPDGSVVPAGTSTPIGPKYADGGADDPASFNDRFDPVYGQENPLREHGIAMMKEGQGWPMWQSPEQKALAAMRAGQGSRLPIPANEPPQEADGDVVDGTGIKLVGSTFGGPRPPMGNGQGEPASMPSAMPPRVPVTGGTPAPEPDEHPIVKNDMRDTQSQIGIPYPDLNIPNDESRKWARNPWLALMNAGFGMMAGTSPWAGVNIGHGLQEGVKTLEQQRKDLQTEEGINQRARQLSLEAQKHIDDYTKIKPAEQERIKIARDQLEAQGWQKGGENVLTGDTTWFNPRTGESGVLKADGTWTPGKQGQAGGPPGTATPQGTTPPTGKPEAPKPPVERPYGVDALASNLEPGESNIGYIGKGSPMAQASMKDIQTTIAQQNKSAALLPAMKQDLAAMKASFATLTRDADKDSFLQQLALQPGATFGDRLELAKKANAIKIAAGEPPPFNPEKLAAAENINKIQNRMGLTFAAQISPREAFAGQKIGIESSPGLTNSPAGFRRLIAGFEAAAENASDEHKFFQSYLKKNGTSLGWRQDFEAKNPAERYLVKHLIGTLPEEVHKHLAEDVEALKKAPTPKNIELFNKHYADTANYFLQGHM